MEINRLLLAELANLLKRYAPSDWHSLADALENEDQRTKVIATLRHLAEIGIFRPDSKTTNDHESRRRQKPKSLLLLLKQNDPRKFGLLTRVRQKLISRELLPTAPELRTFAGKVGVDVSKERKREQAVSKLVRALADLTSEDIQNRLGFRWEPEAPPSQSQYDQWVGVIMGKDRQIK
jgi:hypothetical protein